MRATLKRNIKIAHKNSGVLNVGGPLVADIL